MKIRLTVNIDEYGTTGKAGEFIDVREALGAQLIRKGKAEFVKEKKQKDEKKRITKRRTTIPDNHSAEDEDAAE